MRAFPFIAGIAGSLCLAPNASAQRVAEVRSVVWLDSAAVAPAVQVVQPSRTRYVWGGAAIGAGLSALALLVYFQADDTECLGCHPIMFAPVVAGGGLVGALGGFVVHGWVAEQPDRRTALGFRVSR